MGDFFPLKRKDVVDKLRRRLEHYRHHHSTFAARYNTARQGIYEQQKQDTLYLQQRWLESKAKKAAKQSKANRENNSAQNDHRNLVVSKLKRKIDSVSADASSSTANTNTTTSAAETVFNFDDQDKGSVGFAGNNANNNANTGTNSGGGAGGASNNQQGNNNGKNNAGANPGLPSVSVQIVQQISAHPQQDTSQTIHTNVTVSSRYGHSHSPSTGGSTSASHSVHTSVQCKQEPSEDIQQRNSLGSTPNTSSASSLNNTNSIVNNNNVNPLNSQCDPVGDFSDIGIADVDELQNILDSIDKDDDIDPAVLKQLSEFNEIYDKVQRDSESNESSSVNNMYRPLACGSPGLSKSLFPGLGHPGGPMGGMFDTNPGMNATMATNPSIPVPPAIPEPTGPAAETLKQMAAQHQHQHSPGNAGGYPMKGLDHFGDGLRNGGFPPNYSQLYRSTPPSAFPYSTQGGNHMADPSQMTPDMAAALGYGGTKPLSHFANDQRGQQQTPPSSLQQLQNQVQSHFKPSSAAPHQMQITQTQHMQVSHGHHSMQMSQTQQVQMQQPSPNISMSQQQNFNMGQQQMVTDQMKMQMMEKMRMEQQQHAAQQGRMPPQYMGRPPPEYKMHPNARPQGPYPGTQSTGGPNPLQTMQNMVNQTTAYGAVKTEVPSVPGSGQPNTMLQTTQMTAMQQQNISVSMANSGPTSHAIRPGFHGHSAQQTPQAQQPSQQPQQQQSSAPVSQQQQQSQQPHLQQPPAYSSVDTSSPRAQSSSATYTSAIMRNQRPPNVNVGPDGLNISQPRTHADWPRGAQGAMMGPGGPHAAGMRPNGGPAGHSITQSTAMSAHMMQYQQHRPPHYGAGPNSGGMASAAGIQQGRPTNVPQAGRGLAASNGMMPNGTQMMLQHQSMQVSQQMSLHASTAGYGMGGNPAGMHVAQQGPNPSQGAPQSQPPSSGAAPGGYAGPPISTTTGQDEFLHFLDNPLGSQPMFDSIQNSSADDFSLLDDILNEK